MSNPADYLLNILATLLTAMFLSITGGDIALARATAEQTIKDYEGRNCAELLLIAQIIAFGLAALASLSQSMADDLTPNQALRFRGNANSLNRAAEKHRETLQSIQVQEAPPESEADTTPEEAHFLSEAAEQILNAESEARLKYNISNSTPEQARAAVDHQDLWAKVMQEEANEMLTRVARMSPQQRRDARIQIAALNGTAAQLRKSAR